MGRKRLSPSAPESQDQSLTIDEALKRAYAHWEAGQAPQAEMLCQRVLAAWPGQADALHLLGVMAHAFGNLDLGLQHLRQACLAPRAPAVYFSNLAEMCRQTGVLAEAEQAARRATALNPELVSAWNNLGIVLQEAGKLEESAACLERVTRLQPDNPEARNNLGNTYMRLKRLKRAAAEYERALSLQPNYVEAHSNLAFLLHALGRYEEAATAARQAIYLNPRMADAYLNLAEVELARQRQAEALRWLDALLTFAPNHPGGLAARARTLKHDDRLDEALAAASGATMAAPQSANAHNALGEIQQALGRHDQALASFAKAAALPGTERESARINQATLLVEIGRAGEAAALLERILEANPHSVLAWTNWAELKTFGADDPDIARMEALLGPQGIGEFKDRMTLHFALAKAYLDHGDSARAFRHLGEGNRMKRSTYTFDADATARWMRDIADTFTPTLMAQWAGAGDGSALPVFVLGIPRSGTTLIEQILASHPEVRGAGELRRVQRLVDGLGDYPAAVRRLGPAELKRMSEAYLASVEPLAGGRSHVVDKMPANFLHAGLIHLMLPNARIIHCRRDPVDTCLSCYTKLFGAEQAFAYDLTELGRFHRAYQGLMDHWRAVLPRDRFIEVAYEAVVADLESEARRLIGFLGLPWDESCLTFHATRRPVRTASVNQVRQPIYRTSTGRWKAHAAHLGPLLTALGVDPMR
ncbi:MAG TPA: sulfotransferase [Caulobacteraceae bacterium]|nr:sulfotransferase [Caulobacteraceae bacterium]